MERSKRFGLAALWVLVAVLVGRVVVFGPVDPVSMEGLVRLAATALTLFLAGVYAFDPRNVVSERPF